MEVNTLNQNHILNLIQENKISSDIGYSYIKRIIEYRRSLIFCEPGWVKTELKTGVEKVQGNILLFDTDKTLYEQLNKEISNEKGGRKLVLVLPGKNFSELSPDVYSINLKNQNDPDALLNHLREGNQVINSIIINWTRETIEDNLKISSKRLENSIYFIFNLVKSIHKNKISKQATIFCLYNALSPNPLFSAVSGFLKTAVQELRNIKSKLIYFSSDRDPIGEAVFNEIKDPDTDIQEVKYQDTNERYTKRIVPVNYPKTTGQTFKENGVYIITGGLGGLGLIISKYLLKNYKARLIVCGRGEIEGDKKSTLVNLTRINDSLTYLQTDVGLSKEVKELIKFSKEKYGKIDGIIHSAGVINDGYIINKSKESISSVIEPKVLGTINLDAATKNEELDFFMMFSSITSIKGNAGQSDYAYANSFLDDYAKHRDELVQKELRSGKSISINWPLWKDGGMHVDKATENYLVNTLGMELLDSDKGIFALEECLLHAKTQMILFDGNAEKLSKYFDIYNSGPEKKVSTEKAIPTKNSSEELRIELQKDIISVVSEIVKLDEQSIEIETDLSDFGFDSISYTEFTNILNEKYKLDITPAVFFEYPTIDKFIPYLVEEHKTSLSEHYNLTVKEEFSVTKPANYIVRQSNSKRISPVRKTRRREIKTNGSEQNEPIAIIGMAGLLPKSNNVDEFWTNLVNGKNLISEIPKERWDWKSYYGDPHLEKNKTRAKWGGFIENVESFDNTFFGISQREAEVMDPQQRIFLQIVWKTLEDAGYKSSDLNGSNTGVYVGVSTSDYDKLLFTEDHDIEAYQSMGLAHSVLANRVSYFFDWHGPSEPIDTACSSSLIAIHRAVESLQNNRCSLAIAGGVNLLLHPYLFLSFSKAGMLSEDGKCKTFDAKANGYVRGEGAGAILLKPLSKAIQDKDRIYAVIKGTAENHGGKATALTAPNPNAQASLLVDAYTRADVDPSTVSYIEAHGTGTSLGDPIEIQALKKAFNELGEKYSSTWDEPFCGLSAVKSNIGHLESAAGIAGMLKVILSFKNKKIPATINFNELNPYIKLEDAPFYIASETKDWNNLIDKNKNKIPRRAGISSFGFGGANSHIVLEEYNSDYAENETKTPDDIKICLFVVSARKKEVLTTYLKNYLTFISDSTTLRTSNDAYGSEISNSLKEGVGMILGVEEDFIHEQDNFEQLGFDLLKYNQLSEFLNERFSIAPSLQLFNEYDNCERLTHYLANNIHSENNTIPVSHEENSSTEPSNNGYNLSLRDLSYTSLVGREEFEERVAFVVDSISQLSKKISQFLENDKSIENVYSTINNESTQNLHELFKGETGESFIRKIVEKQDLNNLAQLWVNKVKIPFKDLFKTESPQIVSAPTYPFEQKNIWFNSGETKRVENNRLEYKRLHTFIDSNESNLHNLKYRKTFRKQDLIIREHTVFNKGILPGAAYLELVRAAGELAIEKKISKIKNVIWHAPISMAEESYSIDVDLYSGDNQSIEFKITGTNNDEVHCTGQLEYLSDQKSHSVSNIEDINTKLDEGSITNGFYDNFKNLGINYGHSFQTIKKYFNDDTTVVSRLNTSANPNLDDLVINPFILDGAFQSIALNTEFAGFSRGLYLPYKLEELELIKPIEKDCYSHIEEVDTRSENEKSYNILLFNDKGDVMVKLNGFIVRKVQMRNEQNNNKPLFYSYSWINKEIPESKDQSAVPNLIFASNTEVYSQIRAIGSNTYWISPANNFRKHDDQKYEINLNDKVHVKDFLKETGLAKSSQISILYLLDYTNSTKNENAPDQIYSHTLKIVNLFQGLHQEAPKMRINFQYTYSNQGYVPFNEAIYKLLKTYSRENSNFYFAHVGIDNTADSKKTLQISNSEICKSLAEQVKYEGNTRLIRKLSSCEPGKEKMSALLHDKKCYMITGGLGGLGIVLSKYLIKNYKADLVLIGRSAINEKKELILEELKSSGTRITYLKSDLSELNEIETIVNNLKQNGININGIFHLAGATNDSLLINKTEESVRKVFTPKVAGLINLDEATKNEKLDFFVGFSSLAAVVGNYGQSDYAFANGFIDSFLQQRNLQVNNNERTGFSISINWPIWRNGGMTVDGLSEKQLSETTGLSFLDTEIALSAMEDLMTSDVGNASVVTGNKNKIEKYLGIGPTAQRKSTKTSTSSKDEIKAVLSNTLEKTIKLAKDEIDEEAQFDEFGMDSISIMSFTNEIYKTLKIQLDPSIFIDYGSINELTDYLHDNEDIDLSNKELSEKDALQEEYNAEASHTEIKWETGYVGKSEPEKSEFFPDIKSLDTLKLDKILLTGSTGILGSYIVKELLENTQSDIYCLVRSDNEEKAKKRILLLLQKYNVSKSIYAELNKRVFPVIGDISKDQLGLSSDAYNELSGKTDGVIHSAASTNLYLSFRHLEKTNVEGAKNIIQFALATQQKYLMYVSSYSVMGDLIYTSDRAFKEQDFNVGQSFSKLGYQQSKFEGERLVRLAAKEGLVWDIVRPGNIMGEGQSGIYPFGQVGVSDIYYELFELIIKNKLALFGKNYFDITPVDYVARSITYLVTKRKTCYETYHLVNPHKKTWYQIINSLIELGFPIKIVPVDEYMDLLFNDKLSYRKNKEEQLIVNILKYVFDKKLYDNNSYPDASYTQQILEKEGVVCPEIDSNLLYTLLSKYASVGNIPTPSKQLNKTKNKKKMALPELSPTAFRRILSIQSALESPRVFLKKTLGKRMQQSGWDYLKTRMIKNYEVGFEVRGNAPDFESVEALEKLANEAHDLALNKFSNVLASACIIVREEKLWADNDFRVGHYINMELERDRSKFIQLDIIYDKEARSYAIIAFIYRHVIDAVPALLLLHLINDHIILKNDSYLTKCDIKSDYNLETELRKFNFSTNKEKWDAISPKNNTEFINVGHQIDIENSYISKLRRKLFSKLRVPVTTSSIELALVAIETGMNYTSDCVALGNGLVNNKLQIQSGYKGLGHVTSKGWAELASKSAKEQYAIFCEKIREVSIEMQKVYQGKGRSTKMFNKVSKIPDSARTFSDQFSSYDCIMEIASSQLLGSNLNGIDYGLSLYPGPIKPENIRGIGVPAHPEHENEIKAIRKSKGLRTEITQFSIAVGQLVKGTNVVYKSVKTNRNAALQILKNWSLDTSNDDSASLEEIAKKLYRILYNPDNPLEGRIEKLAKKYYELP